MGAANTVLTREGAVGNTGWLTPADIFDKIESEFGPFHLDPAGNPESYVTQRCEAFCTPDGCYRWIDGIADKLHEFDGLTTPWNGAVFVNPPYRRVEEWVKRGSEAAKASGALVVMLLIPSTDARWFHRYVWDARLHRPREGVEMRLLQGRIRFIHPDPAKRETDFKGFRPISGNMLVVFHPRDVSA